MTHLDFSSHRTIAASVLKLSLLLLLGSPAVAQYDASAPEPVSPLRGSLVLASGPEVSEEIFLHFLELGGGNEARYRSFTVNGSADLARLEKDLKRVTAAWVRFPETVDAKTRTGSARMLGDLVRRGGVVGATGPDAELLVSELGLLPTSSLFTGSEGGRPPAGLRERWKDEPVAIGFSVAPDTALVVRNRRITTVGPGEAVAYLGPGNHRDPRVDRITANRPADLVALHRSAIARSERVFPRQTAGKPSVPHGTLLLGGGGPLPEPSLRRFIELAGGPDALILFLPCTPAETIEGTPYFVNHLRRLGARRVEVFHTKDRIRADRDEAFLGRLKEAGGLWFGGGRQWNFVDSYQHTSCHRLMHEVLKRGGVIGGSSAGASIQAEYMARGNPLGNRDIMAEGYEEGLGFLPGIAVDQHFTERNRGPDLESLVNRYPRFLGLGIDEGTVLWVKGGEATVEGKGRVTWMRGTEGGETEIHPFGEGSRFDLATGSPAR